MSAASDDGPPRPRAPSSSSTDSDTLSRLAASAPTADAMDVVREFRFRSPLLDGDLALRQPDVGGSIGFKLYPAALYCCKLLEHMVAAGARGDVEPAELWRALGGSSPVPPPLDTLTQLLAVPLSDSVTLELGAGICGLPSQLLARVGARTVATVRFCSISLWLRVPLPPLTSRDVCVCVCV